MRNLTVVPAWRRLNPLPDAVIDLAEKLYKGFFLTQPVGNNAFSFEIRENRKIFVAPLMRGSTADLFEGTEIVFSEVREGVEENKTGLQYFVHCDYAGRDVFIFDNHNHAFFFWVLGIVVGKVKTGSTLVHVDQHKDTRHPTKFPDFVQDGKIDLSKAFTYTNEILNVGNFIQPALTAGFFNALLMIDHEEAFAVPVENEYVLDLDMDIFSPEMEYIDRRMKVQRIRELIAGARWITIATSPYFMNQQEAIRIIRNELLV